MRGTRMVGGAVVLVIGLLATGGAGAREWEISDRGVLVDLSFAKLDGVALGLTDSRFGLRLGGFVSFEVSESLTVQPEFALAMKGAEDPSDDDTVDINYLEIPVLFKRTLATGPGGAVKPQLFAGPYLGFRLSAEDEDGTDFSDEVEFFDLGLVLGGGASFDVGSGTLTASLRYSLGLTDLSTDGDGIKNRVLSFGASYSF